MSDKTILLVDDEPELLAVNREAVESLGVAVLTAGNGSEALDLLSEIPVDLVVTDLRMPRLGGREMLEEMRCRGIDADVIFLTGYGTVESAVECIQLGAADYLLKPFDIRELLRKIQKVLRESAIGERGAQPSVQTPQNSDPEALAADGLERVLGFGQAMHRQRDVRSVIKEYLLQLRETFSPESMALVFGDGARGDMGRDVFWGALLRDNERLRTWFETVAHRLMDKGRPKLFETLSVRHGGGKRNVSAMLAPIVLGSRVLGMTVLLRDADEFGSYSLPGLQLLSVFAAHAGSALDSVATQCRMQDMNLEIITSHVRSVEAKDVYTKGHSERVGAYAAMLGREIGLGPAELEQLSFAGVLHDIGKIGIPDKILNKPGPLDEAEYEIMRQHPVLGRDILADLRSLRDILPLVYHHHEWVNGQGYPDRLTGDSIPFLARIVSVVDGFEAMVSDRAYQGKRTVEEACAILQRGAGIQWDENLVRVWCQVAEKRDVLATPMPGSAAMLLAGG